ncbi:SlyX family protein [Aquirhabdus sp.]|uniref:SlyX family protein n=1 Tax=Aquirhabdus sp. TaxID=2824160 RepID=UPI00396CCAF3
MMNEHCDKRQLDEPLSIILRDRIDELEIRVAFLDDLMDSLNSTVAAQAQQLMDLQDQFKVLYSRMESANKGEGIAIFDAAAEVPPHY